MRHALPHLDGELVLTEGGLETTLAFLEGIDLPAFAAFPLLDDDHGRATLRDYFTTYATLAERSGLPMLLDTPTWRANPDWGAELGRDAAALADANGRAAELLGQVREAHADRATILVEGAVGPRGDGYVATAGMAVDEAAAYHRPQVAALAAGGVDLVCALTMTTVEEGAGIALAAADVGVPSSVSFTVELDGRLPDGTALGDAVEQLDALTEGAAAYVQVNCMHPTHVADALLADDPRLRRVVGLRANASTMSHEELDAAETLDIGDPDGLARQVAALADRLPDLRLLGGCCGTDERHIERLAAQLTRTPTTA